VELQSRACIAADFLTTIMHANRYHMPAITHASSGYKSQRRDQAERKKGTTERKKKENKRRGKQNRGETRQGGEEDRQRRR